MTQTSSQHIQPIALEKMESILECPITKIAISDFAMTCLGSIYERSAIEEWLKKHHTDPLTNLVLPTKILFDVDPPHTMINIQQQSDQCRFNMRNGWGTLTTISRLLKHGEVHKQKKVVRMQRAVTNFQDKTLWKNYSNAIFDLIITSDSTLQTELVSIALQNTGIDLISKINFSIDSKLKIQSPRLVTLNPRLGCGLQFLDLSTWKSLNHPLSLSKSIKQTYPTLDIKRFQRMVTKTIFIKGLTMIGTNLSGITFYDCSFFRTDFSYANLNNVWFINCRFSGEQLVFYKTKWNQDTSFIDCLIESFNKHETRVVDDLQLIARGFEITDDKKPFIKNRRLLSHLGNE